MPTEKLKEFAGRVEELGFEWEQYEYTHKAKVVSYIRVEITRHFHVEFTRDDIEYVGSIDGVNENKNLMLLVNAWCEAMEDEG